MKSKTVVLVTHQIQFIKKATKILVLNDGRPLGFGSYDELSNSGIDFMSLIKDEKSENEKKKDAKMSEELIIAEQIIARKRTISSLSNKSDVSLIIYITIMLNKLLITIRSTMRLVNPNLNKS